MLLPENKIGRTYNYTLVIRKKGEKIQAPKEIRNRKLKFSRV